jgi:transcriptional regulator with GAF, ATPase, and Fis domain
MIIEKAINQAVANRSAPRPTLYTGEARGRFGLVGQSAEMHAIFSVIERVADTPSTVLITGESGTGKELVAKALHEQSSRKTQPFIKINCAAIPKTLMESELFGYEKGAFTGATSSKPGRFELADAGTLFLDEIGEIPVEMQVKLLRAIQESEFERVGGLKTIKVDVRLITATNRDLEQEIQRGNFGGVLSHRLDQVPLQTPRLRRSTGDVALLVSHIITKFNERLKRTISGIADDALAALESHHWPGNIRGLENVLERTILFCKGERIERADLQLQLPAVPEPVAISRTTSSGAMAPLSLEDVEDDADELAGTQSGSLKDIVRAETSRVERELIVKALDETGGNVTQAARLLKISRKSLQMKMKELGLRDKDEPR